MKVQFAPSPSGPLHMGSMRTYLANYLWARQNDGIVAVRADANPTSAHYVPALDYALEAFAWLAIPPDELYFRAALSREYADSPSLEGLFGALPHLLESAYLCCCGVPTTPETVRSQHYMNFDDPCRTSWTPPDPAAKVAARRPDAGTQSGPVGWVRLGDTSTETLRAPAGRRLRQACANPVIGRGTQQVLVLEGALLILACDVAGGATHILRGRDLAPLQAAVNLLARRTGDVLPTTFMLPLVRFPSGGKLAKSHGDTGVLKLRKRNFTSLHVLNNLFRSLSPHGSALPELSLSEMVELFDVGAIPPRDVYVADSGLIDLPRDRDGEVR